MILESLNNNNLNGQFDKIEVNNIIVQLKTSIKKTWDFCTKNLGVKGLSILTNM